MTNRPLTRRELRERERMSAAAVSAPASVPGEMVDAFALVPAGDEAKSAEMVAAETLNTEIVPVEAQSAEIVPARPVDTELVPAPAAEAARDFTVTADSTSTLRLEPVEFNSIELEPAAFERRGAEQRATVESPVAAHTPAAAAASVSDFDQLLTGLGEATLGGETRGGATRGEETATAEIPVATRAGQRGKRAAVDSGADAPEDAPAVRSLYTSPEIPLAPAGMTSASSWAEDAKQSPAQPPRKPFVPTTSTRSTKRATAPKSGASKNGARRLAAKGVTLAAMSFALLMAVATSLPAEALLSSSDVEAAARETLQPVDSEPAQSLDIAGGTDTISVQRDGYESKSIAEVAAASGIRLEGTFTNNPNGTIQWPFAVGVHIGDNFGYRNCAGCSSNHGGQDFNPGVGAPIQAVADGVVSLAEDGDGSLGVHMIIDHMIDGKLVSSVYAHMQSGSMNFKTGDVVKVGQVIGLTGNTGMSTGPHLHLEIRVGGQAGTKIDPLEWLYANVN